MRRSNGGGVSSYGGSDRGSDRDGSGSESRGAKYDDPPNSRLFIVCGKQITEEAFRESFGLYGAIEEVWVLKDRVTGEPKGVTYIKFSKTSEAALAMEEMNGKCIVGSPRPLKVLIAHSRDQGSRRDMNEDERLVRLFVVVSKTSREGELREHFAQFGDIDYVSIVKDRNTKENKGFAYVKYHRMSHAAKAYEECDRSYKPVFADPKPQKSSYHDQGGGGDTRGSEGHRYGGPGSTASVSTSASYDMLSYMDTSASNPDGICRLSVSASSQVNQDQLWKLFDLVPGLDYCDRPSRGMNSSSNGGGRGKGYFTVVYNNPQSATYAREKLHGFEYPPGSRMVVGLDTYSNPHPHHHHSQQQQQHHQQPHHHHQSVPMSPARHNHMAAPPPPLQQQPPTQAAAPPPPAAAAAAQPTMNELAQTIANATALLQAAGYATGGAAPAQQQQGLAGPAPPPPPQQQPAAPVGETYDPSYCSVKLPGPQPLAAMDSEVAERLFLVCTPVPPALYALKDVFGRFGSLIDIYLLNGKSCGYAKYASKESADRAVASLHGQEICGSRMKVMPADPQGKGGGGDSARKRPKLANAAEEPMA